MRRYLFLLALILSVALTLSSFAQTGNDSSTDKPKEKKSDDWLDEANEALRGSDTEELEERINPIEVLTKIVRLMAKAKEQMTKATTTKIKQVSQTHQDIDNEFEKLFKRTKENQSEAIKNIEKLIKFAKENSCSSSCSQQHKNRPHPKPKPRKSQNKNQPNKPNASNPAKKPYTTDSQPPRIEPLISRGSAKQRWGDLPPKIQEIITQRRLGETLQQYEERIEKYFKILSEEE